MIISAHQPAYNPWLGYFHKILLADVFVIMDDVQFEKNSFINRNKIFQKPEGLMLTIPCNTKNYKEKTIAQIEVSNTIWKIKHKKSLEQVYAKAPYFQQVFAMIEKVFKQDSPYLVDYSNALLLAIVEYLHIKTKIVFASELDIQAKKLDYVIELTQKLDGDVFIFGKLGKDYADEEVLQKAGIKPIFQDYQHPVYTQKKAPFIPYLGILDLLFYENKENIKDIIISNNLTKEDIYVS